MDPSTTSLPGENTGHSMSSNNPALKARRLAGHLAQSAGLAVTQWTSRKYTLPDKNVASQVLMYRQLLHTKCRPGLKLSREYQGTPAQKAVLHMPWWCEGIEQTKKMIISYDNLITRLWLQGAIETHSEPETHLDDDGKPPIPHEYWVSRLGFQQPDPVTDFRSGGVLSLAMMVWVVESCPDVFSRFVRPSGEASVLPFGITSINITDMMSKFLMLSKGVDRMDALLSQKPFWRMFADPNALLTCQELSLDLLADVVVELKTLRRVGDENAQVTVFDFSSILQQTERRVEHDLLGAGPGSVEELRVIHAKIKAKYAQALASKVEKMKAANVAASGDIASGSSAQEEEDQISAFKSKVVQQANGLGNAVGGIAGNFISKIKSPGFNPLQQTPTKPLSATGKPVDERPSTAFTEQDDALASSGGKSYSIAAERPIAGTSVGVDAKILASTKAATTLPDVAGSEQSPDVDSDGEWTGKDIEGATDQIGNFSIGGEDEDDDDL